MNILDLPFNQHIGLTLDDYDGQQVVCLEPQREHLNHIGTVHAAALYALAEAGSGHALLNRVKISDDKSVAVLRSAQVKYRRPANQKLFAKATIADQALVSFQQRLQEKSRALVDVQVRIVTSDEVEVFVGEFTWFASR